MADFSGLTILELFAEVDKVLSDKDLAMIDNLTYASYKHNRQQFPQISPERWALIFPHASDLEEIYQHQLKNPFAEHGISVEAYNDHIFGRRD